MQPLNKKIGFLGAGNMAEAFIGALLNSGLSAPSRIMVNDILPARRDFIKNTYGVAVTVDNFELFTENEIVILAIKPQHTPELLTQLASRAGYGLTGRKLFISIAAGIQIRKLEEKLYGPLTDSDRKSLPIIRVMPNTPALVRAGISGLSANRYAGPEDIATARIILGALGDVIEFEEKDLDAVTALSGSGPAYVFYLIEAMVAAGVAQGLEAEKSTRLTLATVGGAVKLMQEHREPPEDLRRKVTSPGGTTEAAIRLLEAHDVKNNIIAAINAAADRSKELSR